MSKVGNWTLHFMNARGALDSYQDRVKEAVNEVWQRSQASSLEVVLDIEIEAARYGGICDTGHSGIAPHPGLMRSMLDPYNENLANHLGEHLERMIAHELYHALRWDTVGYGRTLLEALVSEGLCGRFTEELYGNKPELQECAISPELVKELSVDALAHAHSQEYNHSRWFFGGNDLPRWTGYTIGYELVGLAMKKMKLKPSEMVTTEASLFLDSLKTLSTQ